jgi:hypothetical protein
MRPLLFCFALTVIVWCPIVVAPANAQAAGTTLELQIGAQFSTRPLLSERSLHVQRSPGASVGLLVYSNMERLIGLRVHADFAMNALQTRVDGNDGTLALQEYVFGIDAAPRFARIEVRNIEARLYAGAAVRDIGGGGDMLVLQSLDASHVAGHFSSPATHVVGRAGVFARRIKPALLRLDVGYQVARFGGNMQYDVLIRIGVGGY